MINVFLKGEQNQHGKLKKKKRQLNRNRKEVKLVK